MARAPGSMGTLRGERRLGREIGDAELTNGEGDGVGVEGWAVGRVAGGLFAGTVLLPTNRSRGFQVPPA